MEKKFFWEESLEEFGSKRTTNELMKANFFKVQGKSLEAKVSHFSEHSLKIRIERR